MFVFLLITILQVFVQGDYGSFSQIVNIANIAGFFLLQIIFLWITLTNDLDLTLKSQVLHDGQLDLVGINKFAMEKFRVHLVV